MVDKGRRDIIKGIAKGAIYAAPVVYTMAAPTRLLAQGSGGMSFCDQFPVLCMIFGGDAAEPGAAPPTRAPTQVRPPPGQPNFPPPPGSRPRWKGTN